MRKVYNCKSVVYFYKSPHAPKCIPTHEDVKKASQPQRI